MKKSILENYTSCVLTKFIRLEGRASREEFWKFVLIDFLIIFMANFAQLMLMAAVYAQLGPSAITGLIQLITKGLCYIIFLATTIPFFAVSVRRMHDIGKASRWGLLPLAGIFLGTASISLPLLGSLGLFCHILAIYFFIRKGNPEANAYGPNPDDVEESEETMNLETWKKHTKEDFAKFKTEFQK